MTGRAVMLAPSGGLGGGIERYAETLEWAFDAQGIECLRLDLRRPGAEGSRARAHARMLTALRQQLYADAVPTRLVVMHRALLPVASMTGLRRRVSGISLICHGNDVWGARLRLRGSLENHLMTRNGVRVVAVSSFTAGAISRNSPATILPPGLSSEWFRTLTRPPACNDAPTAGIRLVTVFRLADWENKGLPEVLEAVAALGRQDIYVTVCGAGDPPSALKELVGKRRWCTLLPGLSDRQLAGQLAAADLFVLATRTRLGRRQSGEGFGLVLLEAQIAGTPVVGPAYGGSHDAYIEGVTGVTPTDETSAALTAVLSEMCRDPRRLVEMGKQAAAWARESFAPDRYAANAVARLL
jgi:phosphatidylinositol alpha-1,6-mannosyltransferase